MGEIPIRGATVEGGEDKTVECSDELTTISTVAAATEKAVSK
jgi:hypothetical protein